nr:ribonuclease H-like domain-containing protein [Burkholderia pseudomallei]
MDIETSPILGYVWSLWKQNVSLNQIHSEWCILSFCAKWLDDPRVIYHDTSAQRNKEDDRRIVRKLWKLLDQADIVVAQNGVKFDVRKINARFILLGMQPPSPFRVVDTMLEARKHFGFTSNKLEWLTAKLCKTHKKQKHAQFPGFELWREYLAGNPAAAAEMQAYNTDDVLSLEELYLVLRPWITGHPNVGNYDSAENFGVSPGTQFIIPRATVEALKVTKPLRDLPISIEGPDEKTGEYRMTYATDVIIFRAVDGKFPDYRRVVPQRTSGEPTQLNPAYLLDMRKSVELLGSKRIHVQYNGTDAAVITAEDTKIEFVGVVMPERWTDKDQKPHVPPDTSWART